MVKCVYNYSNMLRKITADLGIKDVDLAVGIGVTPSTISNWKNSKSLPYEKDIKRLSKYLLLELESQNLQIQYIDKCLNDIESKIPESKLKNIITAKNQGKYLLTLFLVLSSLCNEDRKNKSINATYNINGIIEIKDNLVNNITNTEKIISCNETTDMTEIISQKNKKKFSISIALVLVFCIAILCFVIVAITQTTTVSLNTNTYAWGYNDYNNLATTGVQIAIDKPLGINPDYINNLYNLQNNLDEQAVLKFGYVFADIQARDNDTEFRGYFNYSYPYGKASLHGGLDNSNYMSCYIYLTKVAVALGNGATPEKATTNTPGLSTNDVHALNDYFANGKVGGSEWTNIFKEIGIYTKNLDPTILRKYKKIFVFGLALHSATDVFRHSAFEQRSENYWTQITHNKDDKIYKLSSNADNPYYLFGCNINNHIENGYSNRYYAAEQIARKVMACYANGTFGTIFDFGLPLAYIDEKDFKIGNYSLYAQAAGSSPLYLKYRPHFEAGNYTIK